MTVKTASELLAQARAEVPVIDIEQAKDLLERPDVVFVDVRETNEYEQGHIPHAVHVPRGLLEWYADPTLPVHKAELRSGRRLVVYCASGGRSLLAAKTLKDMGVEDVCSLEGGITAWRQAGLPVTR
ncbi:Inner membrane protein YgaP [bacterium HR40]|nr:Inner membrane protein YgaP [bacterium HR40]